jgi:hypothetical protein
MYFDVWTSESAKHTSVSSLPAVKSSSAIHFKQIIDAICRRAQNRRCVASIVLEFTVKTSRGRFFKLK